MAHFTQAQITELKAEFAAPEYVGLDFIQKAAIFNTKTYATPQDIRCQAAVEVMLFTAQNDWGELVSVANGVITANQANRKRATSVKELLSLGEVFNARDDAKWTKFLALIDNLISAAIVTAESRDALVALRTYAAPLWTKYLHREFEWTDVQEVELA